MILAETFLDLIKDPNHWAFEGVTDLVFAAGGVVVGRIWVRAHDRKHHDHVCGEDD